MFGFNAKLMKATACSRLVLAVATVTAAALPMAVHATQVTFDWVPTSENPGSGPSIAEGSITLNLTSWALTGTSNPPNFGPFYTSGADTVATITAFSYTAGDGLTVNLGNLSTTTLTSASGWSTSGIDTPATGLQAPKAPTAGYYLITQFGVSGTTAQGSNFSIGNNTGTAGATFQNGIGNGGNNFNAAGAIPAIADGGYWELATPVPLPAALPMLLGGLGLLGVFGRRSALPTVA